MQTLKAADLTKREAEVAHLVSLGLSNKEIADRLGIKDSTVRNTLIPAFDKLGVKTRQQLMVKFFKMKSTGNNKAISKLLSALEFECAGKCAPQNPCNARVTIDEVRSLNAKRS